MWQSAKVMRRRVLCRITRELPWIEVLKKRLQIHNCRSGYIGQLNEENLQVTCRVKMHATSSAPNSFATNTVTEEGKRRLVHLYSEKK